MNVISGYRFPSIQHRHRRLLFSWCDCATSIGSMTVSGTIGRSGSCPPGAARMCQRREGDHIGGRGGHSREPRCPARDWERAVPRLAGRDSRAVLAARVQHKAMNLVRSRILKWGRRGVEARKTKHVARGDDHGDEGVRSSYWRTPSRFSSVVRKACPSQAWGRFREEGLALRVQSLRSCMCPSRLAVCSPA